MILDLDRMKQLIYTHAEERLRKSYGIVEPADNEEQFSELLLQALNQKVKPVKRHVTNVEVFEAAVKSIGSNSRDWSTFMAKEPRLRGLLSGYDPIQTSMMGEAALLSELRVFFPGTSCSTDCRAVANWVQTLTSIPDYYEQVILQIVEAFHKLHAAPLTDGQVIICVAGLLSNPSRSWRGWETLDSSVRHYAGTPEKLKLHGMGYPLASEFFRNLGWNGFKPDRHIKRLFACWYDVDGMVQESELHFYTDLIGSQNKELKDNIRYALLGQKVSPDGIKYSVVDNLLWALGAYVMKKGNEQPLSR